MKEHSSIHRGNRQFRLAATRVARQPLVAHIAKHQLLPQTFGLMGRTVEAPQQVNTLPGRSFDRMQPVSSPLARSVFRPPLMSEGKGSYGISSVSYGPDEVPGQPAANAQSGNRELEVRGRPGTLSTGSKASESGSKIPVEQQDADTHTQITGTAKAKRFRGHIEEQLPEAEHAPAYSPAQSTSVTRQDAQGEQALEKSDVEVAAPGSEVSEVDELFAPRNRDRSPQAWLTRLTEAARSAVSEDSDTSQARPSSAPLSQRARRFLQPLVGIDPASVRVHRDAIAERLTTAYRADAITIGDDIEVAAGYPDDTPETLGLLAHELTHVARKREPRFIPPIARSMRPSLSGASQSSLADEETLALHVESQVRRLAQERSDQVAPEATVTAGNSAEAYGGTTGPLSQSRAASDAWGGLPAPWEPLPDWLVSLPGAAEGSTQVPVVLPQQPVAHGTDMINGDKNIGSGDTGVQRAGTERSVDVEEGQVVISIANATKAPEPNLDELARQVYSLLKRRLGVESRREN